jgi:hypothetical protein
MKKVLLGLIALAGVVGQAMATIKKDTAYGGQLVIGIKGTVIVQPHDTVTVKQRYGFTPVFTVSFIDPVGKTFANATAVPDTVTFTDSMAVSAAGSYFTDLISYGMHGNDTSSFAPVVVTDIWVIPTEMYGMKTPASHGGVQYYTYNTGHSPAKMYVFVSPGDTNLAFPYLVDTFTLNGTGTNSYIFSGYPSSYYFSYKFMLVNPIDTADPGKQWILTSSSGGAAFTGDVDSSWATTDSAYLRTQVLTNGLTTTVTDYYGLYGGSFTDSVTQTIIGSSGTTPVWGKIGGLKVSTKYQFKRKVTNSSGGNTSAVFTFTTGAIPAVFSIKVDTVYCISGSSQRMRLKVNVPAGMTAQVSTLWADSSDVDYSVPIYSPLLVSVVAGVTFLDFDCPSLTKGNSYHATPYGFPSVGSWVNPGDTNAHFTFTVPPAVINAFTASSPTITSGSSDTLAWSTTAAVSVSITGGTLTGAKSLSGSVTTGKLYATTTYTLTAKGIDGTTTSASVTVTVTTPPLGFTEINGTVQANEDGLLSVVDMAGHLTEYFVSKGQIFDKSKLVPGIYAIQMHSLENKVLFNVKKVPIY